jgi:hypothetical protein
MATTVSAALTLIAAVVAVVVPPVAVADVTKVIGTAQAGLTKPTRTNTEIRKPNISRFLGSLISTGSPLRKTG